MMVLHRIARLPPILLETHLSRHLQEQSALEDAVYFVLVVLYRCETSMVDGVFILHEPTMLKSQEFAEYLTYLSLLQYDGCHYG